MAAAALAAAACGSAQPALEGGPLDFVGSPGTLTPYLAAVGDRAVLSWLEPTAHGHALRVAVRTDAGWDTVGTVVESDSLLVNWADFPSVVPLPGGPWIAHWLHQTAPGANAYHVRMAVSGDSGRTWGPAFRPYGDSSSTEHGFVSIVPWDDGAAVIWLDGRNTASAQPPGNPLDHPAPVLPSTAVRFTTVSAGGFPAPDAEVDDLVCDCCQTGLAVTGGGLVAVYRDRLEDNNRDIAVTRFVEGRWTPPMKVADDGWHIPGCPVNGPRVAARGDSVVVAWYTAARRDVRVLAAFSPDGGATFGSPIRINEGRPTGRVDVVWSGEGAVVSWLEETAVDGSVRVRRVLPDGSVGPARTIATTSTARASGFPRMVATDGGVLIAWTDPDDRGGVRVASLRETR
jgi:hypothetical protein